MNETALNKLKITLGIMNTDYWADMVANTSVLEKELNTYLEEVESEGSMVSPLSRLFTKLMVSSVSIIESKYKGYKELLKNADDLELLKSTKAKSISELKKLEEEQNSISMSISEALFMLSDLHERILQMAIVPDNAQVEESKK